jgi:hypothetical protein
VAARSCSAEPDKEAVSRGPLSDGRGALHNDRCTHGICGADQAVVTSPVPSVDPTFPGEATQAFDVSVGSDLFWAFYAANAAALRNAVSVNVLRGV